MNKKDLYKNIKKKRSYLCVGLDSDLKKIPKHLLKYEDPIFEFNKKIIDATADFVVAYKPNLAFYEYLGSSGFNSLKKTLDYIPDNIFKIADAKRGDIGNTSEMYAKTYFETFNFDAITLSPYMGYDSIQPYLKYKNKWVILLALTSNKGSEDFQKYNNLYLEVIKKSKEWASNNNMMYVVGANNEKDITKIRNLIPNHFLLVPGIGAQGGSLENISKLGFTSDCGLLINNSRNIIYSDSSENFNLKINEKVKTIQADMEILLKKNNLL